VLTIGGEQFDLEAPRLIGQDEAWQALPHGTKFPPRWLGVHDCLRMDTAEPA